MPQYIAFLRGINVGGHRVKMDRLQELFEELGAEEVSTFIASGNVVFSAESNDVHSLRTEIEECLAQGLGYDVPTFLRTPDQLSEVVALVPPEAEEEGKSPLTTSVIFLHTSASGELRSVLEGISSEMDEFRFSETEVYWLTRGKVSESPLFSGGLERAFRGTSNTMRNMKTLRRLVSKIR